MTAPRDGAPPVTAGGFIPIGRLAALLVARALRAPRADPPPPEPDFEKVMTDDR